jgi:hypothetical protein
MRYSLSRFFAGIGLFSVVLAVAFADSKHVCFTITTLFVLCAFGSRVFVNFDSKSVFINSMTDGVGIAAAFVFGGILGTITNTLTFNVFGINVGWISTFCSGGVLVVGMGLFYPGIYRAMLRLAP